MALDVGAFLRANRGRAAHFALSAAVCVCLLLDALAYGSHMASLGAVYLVHIMLASALVAVAAANPIAKSTKLPYGGGRLKPVLTYANGVVLVFMCLSVATGAVEALIHPHAAQQSLWKILLQFAVLSSHEVYFSDSHRQPILHRLVLKCFVPVAALAAWCGVAVTGWSELDALCCVAAAALAISLVVPVLKENGGLLLQRAPGGIRAGLEKARRDAQQETGVLEVGDCKYWSVREGEVVGAMRVRVRGDACLETVLAGVKRPFEHLLTQLTVQLEAMDPELSHAGDLATPLVQGDAHGGGLAAASPSAFSAGHPPAGFGGDVTPRQHLSTSYASADGAAPSAALGAQYPHLPFNTSADGVPSAASSPGPPPPPVAVSHAHGSSSPVARRTPDLPTHLRPVM